MNKRVRNILALLASLLLLVLGLSLAPVSAQEELQQLRPEALQPATRPAALFNHDEHNAKANLEDKCIRCHHSGTEGKLVADESSEGTPCADCHTVKGTSKQTPLRRAYHRQCMDCHKANNKGPTHCSGCHDKRHP
ncbi:acidic tetraheme cytochrome c3 TmcA [Desulfovibrio subterraneus]|uniref:Cytochrome c n=1 Tax=Desulfovibrio subterraneus TaxID=2718620 RepID=A0A7J0BLA3_9BACT|nr:cytochrome c3 family protein [Desulfovibrio subterraneus]GFM33935.1 cytochrome c [Desulfovibrio subterraneus]